MSPKKGYTIHRAMKGPDIANHQRNAQRNASLLIGHVLSKRKKKITDIGEEMEKQQPFYAVGRKVEWCSHHAEQY